MRLRITAEVSGGAAHVQDMRSPGMLHARVVRPPRSGARLVSADLGAVRRTAGVRQVVRDGDYLAVLADDEWRAIGAMNALAASAHRNGDAALPRPDAIHTTLQAQPAQDIVILDKGERRAPAGPTVAARYTRQYVLHGSIGPSCALGLLRGGAFPACRSGSTWT